MQVYYVYIYIIYTYTGIHIYIIWGLAVNVAWKRLMKLSQSYGGEPRSGFCAFWLLCVLAFLAAGIDFGI